MTARPGVPRDVVVAVADPAVHAHLPDEDGVRYVGWDVVDAPPDGLDPGQVRLVALRNGPVTDAHLEALARLPRLELVQLGSAGHEHVLGRTPPGVALANARGVHDAGTAELAVGLLLAVQRGIDEAARDTAAGRWRPRRSASLADRRVLVLGHGSIGAAVRRRLEAFEVDVVPVASRARVESGVDVHGVEELPALLPTVDAVVVTLPGGAGTRHLLDARALASLPDGAVVVNVGRGTVVDTDALATHVRAGRLRAALDVVDPEPLPADHPLWGLPGVLISPHVGGASSATEPRLAALVRRQAQALREGRPPANVVP